MIAYVHQHFVFFFSKKFIIEHDFYHFYEKKLCYFILTSRMQTVSTCLSIPILFHNERLYWMLDCFVTIQFIFWNSIVEKGKTKKKKGEIWKESQFSNMLQKIEKTRRYEINFSKYVYGMNGNVWSNNTMESTLWYYVSICCHPLKILSSDSH